MKLYKIIIIIIIIIIIVCLIGINVVQYNQLRETREEQVSINENFKAEIGRIAAGIQINKAPTIIAIEHAFKASALAEHTQFKKGKIQYISVLTDTLRHQHLNSLPVRNAEEVRSLLAELSENPEDLDLANEVILQIKKN